MTPDTGDQDVFEPRPPLPPRPAPGAAPRGGRPDRDEDLRRRVLANLADPAYAGFSDADRAGEVGASPATVGNVRREMEGVRVPIDRVVVAPGRRAVRDVAALAESIDMVGLLNPITVTLEGSDRYRLVAGRHRLEACRSLGWIEIRAVIVSLDNLHAELAEIDENLVRRELTVLERAEQFLRRKTIYETLHPEVKHGGDRRSAEAVSSSSRNECGLKRFTEDTAEKVGVSERTIQGDVQIAERIPAVLRDKIRDTPLADRKTDLLDLARLDPDQQERIVTLILASAEPLSVQEALERLRGEAREERGEGDASLAAGRSPKAPAPGGAASGASRPHDALHHTGSGGDDVAPAAPVSSGAAEPEPEPEPEPTPVVAWTDSEIARWEQAEGGAVVLANMHCDKALNARAKASGKLVVIDRTTPLGNPMKLEWMNNDRNAVVRWYAEHWFPFMPQSLIDHACQSGNVLACWCYPEPCHGDVLLESVYGCMGGEGVILR